MKDCVTHHYACDCREDKFKKLEVENGRLKAALEERNNFIHKTELFYEAKIDGQTCVVEYEPDSELRDYEQISLLENGGIETFIKREVLPYTPDAWIVEGDTKIGYEVSFTKHFYKPPQLRSLSEISADILKLEQEAGGLLTEITKGAKR